MLEQQKYSIQTVEAEIRQKKTDYTTSLRNLELISERIHRERRFAASEACTSDAASATTIDTTTAKRKSRDVIYADAISVAHETSRDSTSCTDTDNAQQCNNAVARAPDEQRVADIDNADSFHNEPAATVIEQDLREKEEAKRRSLDRKKAQQKKPAGVLLLANELVHGTLFNKQAQATASSSSIALVIALADHWRIYYALLFSYAPEEIDFAYRTVPAGIRAVPSPQHNAGFAAPTNHAVHAQLTPPDTPAAHTDDSSDAQSLSSSLSTMALNDDSLDSALVSNDRHEALMRVSITCLPFLMLVC